LGFSFGRFISWTKGKEVEDDKRSCSLRSGLQSHRLWDDHQHTGFRGVRRSINYQHAGRHVPEVFDGDEEAEMTSPWAYGDEAEREAKALEKSPAVNFILVDDKVAMTRETRRRIEKYLMDKFGLK